MARRTEKEVSSNFQIKADGAGEKSVFSRGSTAQLFTKELNCPFSRSFIGEG